MAGALGGVARPDGAALMLVSRSVREAWLRMSGRCLAVPSSIPGALGARRRCRRHHQLDHVVLRQAG